MNMINFSQKYIAFKNSDKEFKGNLKQIARHFNVNLKLLCKLMIKKNDIDKCLKLCMNINYNLGRDFNNDKILKMNNFYSKNNSVNILYDIVTNNASYYCKIHNRVNQGMTLNEAIKIGNFVKNEIFTVFKDSDREFTGTRREISKNFNITYELFKSRTNQGMTFEEAIDLTNNNNSNKNKVYTVFKGDSKEFTGTRSEICNHFGIKYINLIKRMNARGMTIEEAIEKPLKQIREKNLNYNGEKINLKDFCKECNKSYEEVKNLILHNHTLEWAIKNAKNEFK